jgi:SAM-dependent methyltransferase
MNIKVLNLVVCPECGGDFHLEVLSENSAHIIDGILRCDDCGKKYPIIDGVPRLLPNEMIGNLLSYHREFFTRYESHFSSIIFEAGRTQETILKQRTLRSFSFQWNTFGKVYMEYGQHWNDYLPNAIKPSYFEGKTGLDVGCGFGRHIIQAAHSGAEMVGIDLSEAVLAAYNNTKNLPNVHIIQGDIYSLPFRKGSFDFIYSIGVLHHLPDPQRGFQAVIKLLDARQHIFIWCYDNEKPKKNAMYEHIRRYTTRITYRNLYFLTFIAALGVRLLLNYPAMFLNKFGMTNRKFPYDYYIKYPFRVLHADLFDVFAVPSTKYYEQSELKEWFVKETLEINEIKHAVSGWTIYGGKV